jgi:hypothetical protein
MTSDYKFLERAGRCVIILFIVWVIVYVLDRWIIKTNILVNCCSLLIAIIAALLFEFIVGFVFEVD